MADTGTIRRGFGAADFRDVPRGAARKTNLLLPRLWAVQLSGGILPTRELLAWRAAHVEPFQLLRRSFPGAVEHYGALPTCADLPAPATDVVTPFFLRGPFVLGRARHVLAGANVDLAPTRRRPGRGHFRFQWARP